MNDLNGRLVPDSSTANPPAYNNWQAADRNTLISAIFMLEEKNKKLKAENAELREKSMTNFERLIEAADPKEAANMIYDGLFPRLTNIDYEFILKWLKSRKSA